MCSCMYCTAKTRITILPSKCGHLDRSSLGSRLLDKIRLKYNDDVKRVLQIEEKINKRVNAD